MNIYITTDPNEYINAISFKDAEIRTNNKVLGRLIESG
jgi:hypothetical protein